MAGGHLRLSRFMTSYSQNCNLFSISSFLQSDGLTIILTFRDPRLPWTWIQQTRSAAPLSTKSILRNLNLRLVQMVPQAQKLSNASVQRATRVKANIMW
jgi:hypothetical protein